MTDSTFQADLERGRWDPEFFVWRFLGIKIHRGQRRMFRAYLKRSRNGYRALYLWLMVSAGNRAGKTLALALLIFHSCVYHIGQAPPADFSDAALTRWKALPYHWFHFALQQENAELVHQELWRILEGSHPAQKHQREDGTPIGCPLVDELGMEGVLAQPIDRKYRGDYAWVVLSPLLGGAEIHFRSVAEKALGSLGRDMHGVSLDEAGLIGSKLPFILNEVLHWRRLGTGGQFVLISTPSEDIGPEFADLWATGDASSGDFLPRRFSMRMSSRDNIGYGLTQDDFDAMVEGMPAEIVRQNIDGEFIQARTAYFNAASVDECFVDWLPERLPARKNHNYAQGVDPAQSYDSAWAVVGDVLVHAGTGQPIVAGVYAEQARGKLTTPELVALAATPHNSYDNPRKGSRCSTGADTTGFGGHMFKEALEKEVPTVRSIEFGGSLQKKRKLLGDLRTMMDEGRLFFPRKGIWLKGRRQLLGYKLADRAIEQDFVMAAACMVSEARRVAGLGREDSGKFSYHDTADEVGLSENDGRRWSRTPYSRTTR